MRSTVVFLLSLSFLATACLNSFLGIVGFLKTSETLEIYIILDIVLGTLAFLYWLVDRPDYTGETRPVGITLLAVENLALGVIIGFEALALLLLPLIGLIGVIVGAFGLGLLWLGKGLWDGKEWALQIMFVVVVIGIIVSLISLLFGLTILAGNLILAFYQLWYLQRPHVRDFFYEHTHSIRQSRRLLSPRVSPAAQNWTLPRFSQSPLTRTCQTCGMKNPMNSMYCFNCNLRMFPVSFVPPSGQSESSLRQNLERVQDELQKMQRAKESGKIVDPTFFEKAYSERRTEEQELKAR